jgi:hypothetical protein
MSACIVPVAPDFQDPPSDPESAPVFSTTTPAMATLVTVLALPNQQTFSAPVSDTQLGVALNYRWALDYPPFSSDVTRAEQVAQILPPSDGQPITNYPIPFTLDCTIAPASSSSTHKLILIVADRPFVFNPDPNHYLDTIADPTGHVVYGFWPVVMNCPVE